MRAWIMASTFLAGCGAGEPVVLEIDHYLVPCLKERLDLCPLVKQGEETTYTQLFEEVVGFELRWGHRTTVNAVKRQRITASGTEGDVYELVDEVSSEAVAPGTRFVFPFRPNEQKVDEPILLRNLDPLTGAFADGRPFVCAGAAVCEELDNSLGASATLIIDFEYAEPIEDPIIATRASIAN